jgi:hypothetical protein
MISPENIGDSGTDSRIDSRIQVASCPDLARVVTVWPRLTTSLKAAILAIADLAKTSEGSTP